MAEGAPIRRRGKVVSERHYRDQVIQHLFQASLLLHVNGNDGDAGVIEHLDRAIQIIGMNGYPGPDGVRRGALRGASRSAERPPRTMSDPAPPAGNRKAS